MLLRFPISQSIISFNWSRLKHSTRKRQHLHRRIIKPIRLGGYTGEYLFHCEVHKYFPYWAVHSWHILWIYSPVLKSPWWSWSVICWIAITTRWSLWFKWKSRNWFLKCRINQQCRLDLVWSRVNDQQSWLIWAADWFPIKEKVTRKDWRKRILRQKWD